MTRLRLVQLQPHATPATIAQDDSISSPVWLAEKDTAAWLHATPTGNTKLLAATIHKPHDRQTVLVIPGEASDLKARVLDSHRVAIAFAAYANADGSVFNSHEVEPPAHTMTYFTSNYARHWMDWTKPQRRAIFYTLLQLDDCGCWDASPIRNAMPDHPKLASPVLPFGGTDHFDLGVDALVFVAKDPHLDEALHTKMNVYLTDIPDFARPPSITTVIPTPGLAGWASHPVISPNGRSLAFLKMRHDIIESDVSRIVIFKNFRAREQPQILFDQDGQHSAWDRLAEGLVWDGDNALLFPSVGGVPPGTAIRGTLWSVSLEAWPTMTVPELRAAGLFAFTGVHPCREPGRFVATLSSFHFPYSIRLFDPTSDAEGLVVLDPRAEEAAYGVGEHQVTDISVPMGEYEVHSLVIRPPQFDDTLQYPVCFLVHGGPESAIFSTWSNANQDPQVFAGQGYVVVCPNFTGSNGYGQEFKDAIANDWAGRPFDDIRATFEYVRDHVAYADTSRAILGGLSYGGYMTNLVAGRPLGRAFRALFTLNGIFSSHMMAATDELFFLQAELHGLPWDGDAAWHHYDRVDPARGAQHWRTPHLIVHATRDFRVTIDHALAAFNCLQAKGVESGLVVFEDEGHILQRPQNRVRMFDAIFAFCNPKVGLPVDEDVAIVPVR